jgi:hypothetical protein
MTQSLSCLCAALLACVGACLFAACDPIDSCDSNQYYRKGSCRLCPEDAVSIGSTCECVDPDKEFRDALCLYPEGEGPEPDASMGDDDGGEGDAGSDAASAGDATEACGAYCDFLKTCVADNDVAASFVPEVISAAGFEAGDGSGCQSACEADGTEAPNAAALDCFSAMSESAACAGDETFDGVTEATMIIDMCCAEHGESATCMRLCEAIAESSVSLELVPACQ